jgi:Phage capsid family
VGGRPVGGRPVGGRPVGGRPVGGRPVGGRFVGDEHGGQDLEEWAADVADLVCERSAVIRLGATLVVGEELRVPSFDPGVGFRAPGVGGPEPGETVDQPLRPGDFQLEATVSVPLRLVAGIAEDPDLGSTLRVDLADALARRADQAFLAGTGPGSPRGVGDRIRRTGPAAGGGELLERLRNVVSGVRAANALVNPAWILHPSALDTIGRFLTANGLTADQRGRSLDTLPLLRLDGADGGTLLGFPFLTSLGAPGPNRPAAYFSADWQEAWIGVDPSLVTVTIPGDPAGEDAIGITASLPLDFTLRRDAPFAWTVA